MRVGGTTHAAGPWQTSGDVAASTAAAEAPSADGLTNGRIDMTPAVAETNEVYYVTGLTMGTPYYVRVRGGAGQAPQWPH